MKKIHFTILRLLSSCKTKQKKRDKNQINMKKRENKNQPRKEMIVKVINL